MLTGSGMFLWRIIQPELRGYAAGIRSATRFFAPSVEDANRLFFSQGNPIGQKATVAGTVGTVIANSLR